MSPFLFAVDRVLPLFIMAAVGMLLRRVGWIGDTVLDSLNKICFNLLLPCVIIKSALDSDLAGMDSPQMYIYAIIAYTVFTAAVVLVCRLSRWNPYRAGAFAHAAWRGNTMLLGLPLIVSVLGVERSLPAVILTVVMSPFDCIYGVLCLEFFSGSGEHRSLGQQLLDLAKNPLIISAVVAVILLLLDAHLPSVLYSSISYFSGASLPVSMLIIGARFQVKRLAADIRPVLGASACKLVLEPCLLAGGAWLLGIRGVELFTLWIVMAMPTASISSIITGLMGCDGNLGDEMTVTSTALCLLTLIVGISCFVSWGVI